MVESIKDAIRNGKKDIPPMGEIQKVIYACEWKKEFNYPIEKIPIADYYVEYQHIKKVGAVWLIEASTINLHKKIKQIESSADFFYNRKINIDGYLIVLDGLNKTSKRKYFLKPYNKPLKKVYERIGYDEKKEYKIHKKPLFVLFRKDFGGFKR